jgi:imidazolonepropionase-like amidohydrolase
VPGARADLLLVDGDPLDDLAALERVLLVTRDGRVHG